MIDNEIIKALEWNISKFGEEVCFGYMDKDGCKKVNAKDVLDIINRQKAEIEILNNNISSMAVTMHNSAKATRNEAIKWFAERLKEEIDIRPTHSNEQNKYVCFLIDNLVKEMAGEEK